MRDETPQDIIESVREIFIAFLPFEATPGKSEIKPYEAPYAPVAEDVVALVDFSGDAQGGILLAAPESVALGLANAFTGEEASALGDEERDALGELANMITGGIHTRWSEEHINATLTPPSVFVGGFGGRSFAPELFSCRQYFDSPKGSFFVECFWSFALV